MKSRLAFAALLLSVLTSCEPSSRAGIVPADRDVHRIVTLSPHLAELVYTAGAGEKLVGVVAFSDFPPAARDLPRIGDANRIDYERIAELSPDLILGWRLGNPASILNRLRDLGYRVESLDSARLDDVAEQLLAIGEWSGTGDIARQRAAEYSKGLAEIRQRYRDAESITVFYQVSAQPFFTVSSRHTIGEAIELCGGINIFGELQGLSPAVSLEAIVEGAPQAIIAGSNDHQSGVSSHIRILGQWDAIPAVRMGNTFLVNSDLMARSSTRILQGIRQLCQGLDSARARMEGLSSRVNSGQSVGRSLPVGFDGSETECSGPW